MDRRLAAALEVLENQPPGPERAMAYSDLALRIGLYGGQREEAERTADRAVALAETCADAAALGHVQGRIGMLRALLDADDALLRVCLDRARTAGLHLDAGMAYQGLAAGAALRRDRLALGRRGCRVSAGSGDSRPASVPARPAGGARTRRRQLACCGTDSRLGTGQPEGRGITGVHALQTEALL